MSEPLHATLIANQGIGILITGASGAGKTRLAIEAMQFGAKFIADDRVSLSMNTGMLMGSPLPGFKGVLEVRGVGLVQLPDTATQQVIHCMVELTSIEQIERLPPMKESREFFGVSVPLVRLAPPPHTSGAVLLSAVKWVQEGRILPSDWKPAA